MHARLNVDERIVQAFVERAHEPHGSTYAGEAASYMAALDLRASKRAG